MNRKKQAINLLVFSSLAAITALPVAAQERVETRLAGLQIFQDDQVDPWDVKWNDQLGYPEAMMGSSIRMEGVDQSDEQAIANAFYQANKVMLGIDRETDSLVHSRTDKLEFGQTIISHGQSYKNVPVFASGYKMAIARKTNKNYREGDIHYVVGTVFPDIEIDADPAITATDAGFRITDRFPSTFVKFEMQPSLIVLPVRSDSGFDYLLAYKAEIELEHDHLRVIVDAKSGAIVEFASTGAEATATAFFESDANGHLPSVGAVVDATPRITNSRSQLSRSTCTLSPCSDVFEVDSLESPSLTNLHLLYLNTEVGTLNGTWVHMKEKTGNYTASANDGDDYDFDIDDWQFEQLNAYFHMANAAAVLYDHADLKIDAKTNGSTIQAFPVWNATTENYSDSYIELKAAGGSPQTNSHYASAVVIHEYWHLVQFMRDSTLNITSSSKAVWEGVSDFAGVYYRTLQGG